MKKLTITLLLLTFSLLVMAQEKIPYTKLEKYDLKRYKKACNWAAVGFIKNINRKIDTTY